MNLYARKVDMNRGLFHLDTFNFFYNELEIINVLTNLHNLWLSI